MKFSINFSLALAYLFFVCLLVPQASLAGTVVNCPVEPASNVPSTSGQTYAGTNCTLNTANDSDSFSFQASSGDTWQLSTGINSGSQDICLTLYDPTLKKIASACTSLYYKNKSAVIKQKLTTTGSYSLTIIEATTGSVNYGVSLERLSPTPSDAANVALNISVSGNIPVPSDSNPFAFVGVTSGLFQVSSTIPNNATSDLCINLYAPDGSLASSPSLSSGTNPVCTSIYYKSYTAQMQFTPSANGTYLALFTASNAGTASYTLEVSCAAGTCTSSSLQNQTITFGTAPTVVVGGTGTVSATGGGSGNPVVFSSTTPGICTVSGSTVTGVAVGTCTIAANQAGNANYNPAPQTAQSFNIGAGMGNQTISFGAAPTVVVGGSGTVSATGGGSGNPVVFSSTTPGICTVSGSKVTGVAVGMCIIAANQAGNANYNPAPQTTQSFNIGAGMGNQTISLGAAPTVVVGGTGTVSATGGGSGNPVVFSSTTTGICTVSSNTVTGVAVGMCTIAANQAGNANYNPAPQATQSFNIGMGKQTISFGAAPTVVVGGTGTVSATGGGSGNPVVFSSTTTGICTVSGSTVTGVAVGACTIAANQAGNANYNPASQATQSFTIAKPTSTSLYMDEARVYPQVIMVGISPSIIDVSDTSFDILALVRPGLYALQDVTLGQGASLFSFSLIHVGTLPNGDQIWKKTMNFDRGAFGTNDIPLSWGNGNGQYLVSVTDVNQQSVSAYDFPLINSGNFPQVSPYIDNSVTGSLSSIIPPNVTCHRSSWLV